MEKKKLQIPSSCACMMIIEMETEHTATEEERKNIPVIVYHINVFWCVFFFFFFMAGKKCGVKMLRVSFCFGVDCAFFEVRNNFFDCNFLKYLQRFLKFKISEKFSKVFYFGFKKISLILQKYRKAAVIFVKFSIFFF